MGRLAKRDVRTREDVERYFNEARKIRFNENVVVNTINDVCKNMIGSSAATFYVKGKEQCRQRKCRSINDYILISKYYFPKMKIREILRAIYAYQRSLPDNFLNRKQYIMAAYCPTIRKLNFRGITPYDSSYSVCKQFRKHDFNSTFGFYNYDKNEKVSSLLK